MLREIVEQINESPYKLFLAVAGGGQSFIGKYCAISGASKTIVGALVPYHQVIFDKFIKCKPDSYSSSEAARKLAVVSYNECLSAGVEKEYAIGIGAANSIVKDNERPGRVHRIHIALHTYNLTRTTDVVMYQGRSRDEEEHIASYLIYRELSNFVLKINLLAPPVEKIEFDEQIAPAEISKVVENRIDKDKENFLIANFKNINKVLPVFSGSFNPIHDGHLQIKKLAEEILDSEVALELSITNTDKGQLDFIEIRNREQNIAPYSYLITNAPTFVDKVKVLKSVYADKDLIFVMGADTWNRLWSKDYNIDLYKQKDFFSQTRVKFLVFGRAKVKIDNTYIYGHGDGLRIESEKAENFNSPLSSSEIRRKK